ncbi:DUF2637 domain-containing protein [Catelliglobosispora koreensis]|uniref:DUF2637 domain-containing protein n=1 Tax=Catelliglobosispora koreensis TaxID=129052 RepID=UPI00036B4FC9|nr:DUF2637 domain-containing protein [Catelliglobosispora koreensis]
MDLSDLTATNVPTWVMVLVVAILSVSLVIGVPLARAAGKRRGHRLAHPEAFASRKEKVKDTALFLAALIPSLLVWLAVMGVSFIGLTGFAKDVMGWNHWTNMLVPLSLDGISVSFGAWAFVAVKRGRHPGRAYKIVFAAATMSAVLNFVHGRDEYSIWAGAYLAFLSMAGMAMFHELLDQFMAGYDDEVALKTRYPRFGQRWVYAPMSTFAARRAWIVHPPDEGIRPSVRNALDHLEAVRDAKRQRRLDGALRVREEQQAKLVEVHAKAEVRRAKATAGRRPEVAHRPYPSVPQQQSPQHAQPPALRDPDQNHADALRTPTGSQPVLDPVQRAELESIFPLQNGREPMGKHPLWDNRRDETQRMIAEALAMGEPVMPGQVRDWAHQQFGFRPSDQWARDQIKAARSRDIVGMDADLM